MCGAATKPDLPWKIGEGEAVRLAAEACNWSERYIWFDRRESSFFVQFALAGPRGDGLRPYVNPDGAFIGRGLPLLQRDAHGRLKPRDEAALGRLLRIGYGSAVATRTSQIHKKTAERLGTPVDADSAAIFGGPLAAVGIARRDPRFVLPIRVVLDQR